MAQLLAGDEYAEASAPPVHWPSLAAEDIAAQARGLYAWVTRLQHRFPEMVRLPACWYRHNGLVELLSALRDHERACYTDTAAPTAAVTWMTAFRDIEARLRVWVAELRCGGDPRYHDRTVHAVTPIDTITPDDLDVRITETIDARRQAAVNAAVDATEGR
jgi:hypothetical protein